MNIEVIPATKDQEPILANLLELYVHDFSEFLGVEIGADGRFGYKHLPLYWSEPGRHPFLVHVDGKLAGLVLVKRGSEVSGNDTLWDVAEFFVLRGYRRLGIGTRIAHEVFRSFPGPWEVRVVEANVLAQQFWQRAISEFTGAAIHSDRIEINGKSWILFAFESQGVAKQMLTDTAGNAEVGRIEATVNINGAELFYEIDGAGKPLLLLHGGTGCHGDWVYAGREQLVREYKLITPDARGHGRSTNSEKTITHRQCALDTLALLDHLSIEHCKAIGVSMGGNILLHMATLQPERIEAMVIVSATMYFPEQARKIMAAVPPPDNQTPAEWEAMRKRHHLGDEQIRGLWEWAHSLTESYDDMNFTPADLSAIRASTLIVQGDRDPLYPVEMSVEMYRAIPNSALWIVPNGGHGPVFFDAAGQFAQTALAFLRG